MSQNVIQPSFAAGELSPKLYGRVDQATYRIGARKMRNFFVHPGGSASNRPGTEFIGQVADSSNRGRLIPFQFNGQVTYVLEFGDHLLRVIKGGGYVLSAPNTIYQITSPYAVGDLPKLKYTQSADVMTFCHPNYQPQDLSRSGDAAWTFTPISFAPQVARPSGLALSVPNSGSTTYRYKVTAVNADDTEESLPGIGASVAVSNITRANPAVVTTTVAHNLVNGDEVLVQNVIGMAEMIGRNCLVNVLPSHTAELRQVDNRNLDSGGYGAYATGGM